MGSFNQTCAVSNMPIVYRDRVVLLLLLEQRESTLAANGGCYPTEWYTPCSLPIRGSYNDYGNLEDLDETSVYHFLQDFLANNIKELPREEDKYGQTEDAVTRAMFAKHDWLEKLYYTLRDGRLYFERRHRRIASVMIREDVYEALVNQPYDHWRGHEVHFEAHKKKTLDFRNTPWEPNEREKKLIDEHGQSMERMLRQEAKREFFDRGERYDMPHGSPLRVALTQILDPEQELDELALTEYAKLEHIKGHMRLLGRFWHPQNTQGQGRDGFKNHRRFAKVVNKLCRRGEYYDEEDKAWQDEKRAAFWKHFQPPPQVRCWEYNERIKLTDLKDEAGDLIPGTQDYADGYACLYIHWTSATGIYTYCLFDCRSEGDPEWKYIEHKVAPHREVLHYCNEFEHEAGTVGGGE